MLNELRERGSLRSLLQRPEVTGGEGGENARHRLAITIFHLFYQRENGCGLMQQGDYVLFFKSYQMLCLSELYNRSPSRFPCIS